MSRLIWGATRARSQLKKRETVRLNSHLRVIKGQKQLKDV
jgi:hypothetical protein